MGPWETTEVPNEGLCTGEGEASHKLQREEWGRRRETPVRAQCLHTSKFDHAFQLHPTLPCLVNKSEKVYKHCCE